MNNIEAEFLPYDESLALKELGFNEPCFGYYKYDELIIEGKYKNTDHGFSISAPTFSQAFRFFREKYNINSWIDCTHIKEYFFNVNFFTQGIAYDSFDEDFYNGERNWWTTYEEAELECLKKLIEIVKLFKNK